MFSTLKRRVKKIMKKVEEVVETKEMVKLEALGMVRDGVERFYEDLTKTLCKNKNKVGIAVGLLATVVYECIENKIH